MTWKSGLLVGLLAYATPIENSAQTVPIAPSSELDANTPPSTAIQPKAATQARAESAFRDGNYARANALFNQLAQQRPDDARVRFQAAVAAAAAGDLTSAEHHAAHAVRLDHGNPSAFRIALVARARATGNRAPQPSDIADIERAMQDGRFRTVAALTERALAPDRTAQADPGKPEDETKRRRRMRRLRGVSLLAVGQGAVAREALKTKTEDEDLPPTLFVELAEASWLAGEPMAARYYLGLARIAAPLDRGLDRRIQTLQRKLDSHRPD